jgi:heterodisulfide reductase subunit A-like polyferredoxin
MNLTAKKKLRSSIPVWIAYPRHIPFAKQLKRNLKTDVLVVGGGISGALIAYALARDGYRVALVDCRGPLMGSTRRAPLYYYLRSIRP